MGSRIGIVAGSGAFPLHAVAAAAAQGYTYVVAGLRGEARPEVERASRDFAWIGPAEPSALVAFFKSRGVKDIVFVGKVDPGVLVRADGWNEVAAGLRATLKDRTPVSVLEKAWSIGKEEGLWYVYLGNVPGHRHENTYCHGCGSLLIERYIYDLVRSQMGKGRCPRCQTLIPGRFGGQ
jgi:hypothetical protein